MRHFKKRCLDKASFYQQKWDTIKPAITINIQSLLLDCWVLGSSATCCACKTLGEMTVFIYLSGETRGGLITMAKLSQWWGETKERRKWKSLEPSRIWFHFFNLILMYKSQEYCLIVTYGFILCQLFSCEFAFYFGQLIGNLWCMNGGLPYFCGR